MHAARLQTPLGKTSAVIFNSFTFAIFFVVILAIYRGLQGRWRAQKLLLLAASYLFYAAWNPPLIGLLLLSTAVDWYAAQKMVGAKSQRKRRFALYLSLASNLGLLAAFKYAGFFLSTFQAVVGLFGGGFTPPTWDLVLPVGISFYTFQTLSFSIDVYREKLDPKNTTILDFALFVSFFPQLVAGPIVRAVDFLPQLRTERRATKSMFVWGVFLLALGVFEKSLLADAMLAPIADSVFAADAITTIDAWVGAFAFSGQIFFDFAGYSTCAIGVALCFGFQLPDNFWFPYGATGFSEFWQRWHISLSSWLRDYLYISLGGNRGVPNRTTRNLMITMLLGGLWHGASWNFIFWGFLHGSFLVLERAIRGPRSNSKKMTVSVAIGWLVTQLGVLLAWVPFRHPTLEGTLGFLSAMVGQPASDHRVTTTANIALVAGVVGLLYIVHFALRNHRIETIAARINGFGLGLFMGILWILIWLAQPADRAFIYFQF